MTISVAGLFRYPVKSLQGESLDSATLETDGLAGDRLWGLLDRNTGRILTGRRRPELLLASAARDGDTVTITLPGGDTVVVGEPGTDERVSDWLDGPISVVPSRGSERGRAECFADATDDSSEAIEFTMPQGRFVDAAHILVLTTASLRAGAALHPDGTWDPRRFRPNVLLDVSDDGFVEDEWVGKQVRIRDAVLTPLEGCIRCTMVTRPQPGLEADRDIFRTLARHHGARFGVWSKIDAPGGLRIGDHAEIV